MGRELKRVPLDFTHPIDKIWPGYQSPQWRKCPDCENGYTRSGAALETIIRRLMLAGDDSMKRPVDYGGRPTTIPNYPGASRDHYRHWPHPYLVEMGVIDPGDTMHELTGGLAGRPPRSPFGHDCSDAYQACRKISAAAGLPEDWSTCKTCGGHAIHPDDFAASEAWESTEPPTGEGYQLWETVSEGSPISPVFDTAEGLAQWLAENPWNTCDRGRTYEQWLAFIRGPGWAPTLVMVDGSVMSGVEAVSA